MGRSENPDEGVAGQGDEAPEDEVGKQFFGGKIHGAGEEQGGVPGVLVEDGGGHDGGDDAGHDGFGLEFRAAVEDFRGEQGGAEGGVEDGADAAGGPGQDQDAAHLGLELEKARQDGPEARADLGDGALFTGGAAATDGDGGDHDFDQGDPAADVALPVVEGLDHGVGPLAAGLRRQQHDDDPHRQAAQGRDDEVEPVAVDGQGSHQGGFGGAAGLQKTGGQVQEVVHCQPEQFLKEDSAAAGHEAHGDAQQGPAEVAGPAEEAVGYPVGSLGGGDFLRLWGSVGQNGLSFFGKVYTINFIPCKIIQL